MPMLSITFANIIIEKHIAITFAASAELVYAQPLQEAQSKEYTWPTNLMDNFYVLYGILIEKSSF